MEKEKLEIVLAEILDELKVTNNVMHKQGQQIAQLQEKTFTLDERIIQLNQATSLTVDMQPVKHLINTTAIEIKQVVQQQSKPIIRQWRLLLFPEHYSREYYTVIFRLIMWMTLVCSGAYIFSLGKSVQSATDFL